MSVDLILEGAALFLALAAILMQPKRDPNAPASFRNLSTAGQLLLTVIVVVGALKIGKAIRDADLQQREREAHAREVKQLDDNLTDLRETNRHLIKVMSVADGYNALVSGTVTFTRPVSENEIRHTLENLFLKYALVTLHARNKLGAYEGRIDYGVHPMLSKYRRLSEVGSSTDMIKLRGTVPSWALNDSYYFELRCAGLKILNDEKIQYARFGRSDTLDADVKIFEQWGDFRHLYAVDRMFLDHITIEELGDIGINKQLSLEWPNPGGS